MRVEQTSFTLLANGSGDTPPASGLREYLVRGGARSVRTVFHPLSIEDGGRHEITTYQRGRDPRRRVVRLPSRPPYTYPLDLLVPPWPTRTDCWFAFNNLLCARSLVERRARPGPVVYWAVDFVPDRFGAGSLLTHVYDALDKRCCRVADLRVEVSPEALAARNERHRLDPQTSAPSVVAPIGAWLERVPVVPQDAWRRRRVVFIGHLVERMGGDTVLEALGLLAERGVTFTADIAGRGPVEEQLRARASQLQIDDRVKFHGFIDDHRVLERLLADASVALAPYSTRVESFTRFADPSKLKSYLAAGLPILLTDVPPNAAQLSEEGGAEIVADDPATFAAAIERSLADAETWQARREAALTYARNFDWNTIIARVLDAAGFET